MQILQRSSHLRRIELRILLRETLPRTRLQRAEKLPAHAVLHAEIEVRVRLERVVQRHDERVVSGREDLLLRQRPLDFAPLDHFAFGQDWIRRPCPWIGDIGGANWYLKRSGRSGDFLYTMYVV